MVKQTAPERGWPKKSPVAVQFPIYVGVVPASLQEKKVREVNTMENKNTKVFFMVFKLIYSFWPNLRRLTLDMK